MGERDDPEDRRRRLKVMKEEESKMDLEGPKLDAARWHAKFNSAPYMILRDIKRFGIVFRNKVQ